MFIIKRFSNLRRLHSALRLGWPPTRARLLSLFPCWKIVRAYPNVFDQSSTPGCFPEIHSAPLSLVKALDAAPLIERIYFRIGQVDGERYVWRRLALYMCVCLGRIPLEKPDIKAQPDGRFFVFLSTSSRGCVIGRIAQPDQMVFLEGRFARTNTWLV